MLAQEKRDKNALRPETEFLMLTGAASLMTDLMFVSSPSSIALSSLLGLVLATSVYPKESSHMARVFKTIYRRSRFCGVVFSSAVALFVLNFLASPASAQFLNQTEGWMTSSFPQAATFAPLIFNAIRLSVVIYIIIAGIGVFQAMKRDEEWQALLKVPIVLVVMIGVIDVAVGMVTGGGAGNP